MNQSFQKKFGKLPRRYTKSVLVNLIVSIMVKFPLTGFMKCPMFVDGWSFVFLLSTVRNEWALFIGKKNSFFT